MTLKSTKKKYQVVLFINLFITSCFAGNTTIPKKGLAYNCLKALSRTVMYTGDAQKIAAQGGLFDPIKMPSNRQNYLIFDNFTSSAWLKKHQLYEMEIVDKVSNKIIDKSAGYVAPGLSKNPSIDRSLTYAGSFKMKGKEYRVAQFSEYHKGFFNDGTYFFGIYEKGVPFPKYFIQSYHGKNDFSTLRIHQDADGVQIVLLRDDHMSMIIDLRETKSRLLEEKGYRRDFSSNFKKYVQPQFSQTNFTEDLYIYSYGIETNSGSLFAGDNLDNLNSYTNEFGEKVIITSPIWSEGRLVNDKVLFINVTQGEVEKIVELENYRELINEGFVEIGTGIFSMPTKNNAFYENMRVVFEGNEVYLVAQGEKSFEKSLNGVIEYDPGLSFVIHKVSDDQQIITFEKDGQRLFFNQDKELIDPPKSIYRLINDNIDKIE